MNIKTALAWAVRRAKEPSTYAGLAAGAASIGVIAQQAQGVAQTFKDQGPLVGAFALSSAIMAMVMSERDGAKGEPKDGPIETEFTDITDKPKD